MSVMRLGLSVALGATLASPAAAAEHHAFVVTLGRDTTDVERCVREGERLRVEQVSRFPRVLRRHMTFEFEARGALRRFEIAETAPGDGPGPAPQRTFAGRGIGDSMLIEIRTGERAQTVRTAVPVGAAVIYSPAPWSLYEVALSRFARTRPDTARVPFYRIGAGGPGWIRMQRSAHDTIEVLNHHDDAFRAAMDPRGRMLAAVPTGGPGMFAAQRVDDVDVDAIARRWLAAEKASGGMGQLSPRDTVTAALGGATLWVDYGRPAKRGRQVFGGIVPFGEVWRTGANSATQLRTDRTLEIGGHALAPGAYSLWTIPGRDGWKLVVNADATVWGTQHDAAKDLFAVDVAAASLSENVERFTISIEPAPGGGELHLDWDTTRVTVPFRIVADGSPER